MNSAQSLLFFCIILAGMTACNGSHGNDTPSASTPSDTTTAQAAVSKEPEKPEYKSVDLKLFELYGPVRKCVFKNGPLDESIEGCVSYRYMERLCFDEKGRLTCLIGSCPYYISYPEKGPSILTCVTGIDSVGKYNTETFVCNELICEFFTPYMRDKEGRIVSICFWDNEGYHVEYDNKGNTRLFTRLDGTGLNDTIIRTNEHSWPEVIRISVQPFHEDVTSLIATINYSYIRTDSLGNWTERTAVVEGKYMEDPFSEDDGGKTRWTNFNTTFTDRREITYYE